MRIVLSTPRGMGKYMGLNDMTDLDSLMIVHVMTDYRLSTSERTGVETQTISTFQELKKFHTTLWASVHNGIYIFKY